MQFVHYQQEAAFRNLIIYTFNLDDLRTMCADLGILYEDLPGDTLTAKVRELCAYSNRYNVVGELINYCDQVRPNEDWWGLWNQWDGYPSNEQDTWSEGDQYPPEQVDQQTDHANQGTLDLSEYINPAIHQRTRVIAWIEIGVACFAAFLTLAPLSATLQGYLGSSQPRTVFYPRPLADITFYAILLIGCVICCFGGILLFRYRRQGWNASIAGIALILLRFLARYYLERISPEPFEILVLIAFIMVFVALVFLKERHLLT